MNIGTPDVAVYEKYIGKSGAQYESPVSTSYCSIPVLEFLWGKKLTEVTFNWLACVRPSMVRIIKSGGGETTDAWPWRVTMYLAYDDNTIAGITQEAVVGCAGVYDGHDLMCRTVPESFTYSLQPDDPTIEETPDA